MTKIEELKKRNNELKEASKKLEEIAYKKEEQEFLELSKKVINPLSKIKEAYELWKEVASSFYERDFSWFKNMEVHEEYVVFSNSTFLSLKLSDFAEETKKINQTYDSKVRGTYPYKQMNEAINYILNFHEDIINFMAEQIEHVLDKKHEAIENEYSGRLGASEMARVLK